MKKLIFLVVLLLSTCKVFAFDINIESNTLHFNLPKNYCLLDSSSRFYKLNEVAFGSSVKFKAIAGLCDEVNQLKDNKIKNLNHYIAIEQIGVDGSFSKFPLGSYAYILLTTTFKVDVSKFETRLNQKLTSFDTKLLNMSYKLLKSTESFAMFKGEALYKSTDLTAPINLLGITFLKNGYPIAIHSFDVSPSNDDLNNSLNTMKQVIQSL